MARMNEWMNDSDHGDDEDGDDDEDDDIISTTMKATIAREYI